MPTKGTVMNRWRRVFLSFVWVMSTLATLVLLDRLGAINTVLLNCAAPMGILSYEFAGSAMAAGRMVDEWARAGVLDAARNSLRLDFAFLLIYPVSLSFSCGLLSAPLGDDLRGLGRGFGWAALACAPLDAGENLALLAMLDHGVSEGLARAAAISAGIKFALVFAALGFILTCVLAHSRRWARRQIENSQEAP